MRIERALVAGAAGCLAMLRPLCSLMGRDGNALHTVRLGGNGAWAEGDGATLLAALGAASCVVAELDVSACFPSMATSPRAPAWLSLFEHGYRFSSRLSGSALASRARLSLLSPLRPGYPLLGSAAAS